MHKLVQKKKKSKITETRKLMRKGLNAQYSSVRIRTGESEEDLRLRLLRLLNLRLRLLPMHFRAKNPIPAIYYSD